MKLDRFNHPGHRCRGGFNTGVIFLGLLGLVSSLSSCTAEDGGLSALAAIAAQGDHQDWDAIRPVIRGHLLHHPDDVIGHYLYGLSFLHQGSPQLTYAEGEFRTALHLLNSAEDFPAEIIGMERTAFAGQLHRKTALVYMRAYREALGAGLPEGYGLKLLQKANDQVELGLQADPTSTHLLEYAEFLREALGIDSPNAPKIITKRADSGLSI